MSIDTDRVLSGVDAARRVAWAKFYAEREQHDLTAQNLSDIYSERVAYQMTLAHLCLMFTHFTNPIGPTLLRIIYSHLNDRGLFDAIFGLGDEADADRAKAIHLIQGERLVHLMVWGA